VNFTCQTCLAQFSSNKNSEITALFFANDIVFLASNKIVKDIQDALTNAREQAIA
jgi:hypothetical protein